MLQFVHSMTQGMAQNYFVAFKVSRTVCSLTIFVGTLDILVYDTEELQLSTIL